MAKAKKQDLSSTQEYENQHLNDFIEIKGAKSNNLKNIDLSLPKNKLIVITGVSGSGKSSLTMDTLFAEGQRRYVESLSSYARQFLMRMKKPEVDYIKGICPAIAIEQKVTTGNARSTVGSMTEIYDYLRLLYARAGKTYSPVSGELVTRHEVSDVVDYILKQKEETKVQLFIPLIFKYAERSLQTELNLLLQKGYSRVRYQKKLILIEDLLDDKSLDHGKKVGEFRDSDIAILIDRFVVKKEDEENTKRIGDSVQTAFYESEGECIVEVAGKPDKGFNNRFEADGITFLDQTPQLFNYNNPYGACPTCEGYGKTLGIEESKVIPDPKLSVYSGAIACWRGEIGSEWLMPLLQKAHLFNFPLHRPYNELSKTEKKLLWKGNDSFEGINSFFKYLEERLYKIQNRVMLSKFRGKTICPTCEGARLRPEALYVKIAGKHIGELTELPIDELSAHFQDLKLSVSDETIAKRLLLEIKTRLGFMIDLGLPYLSLDRIASTLSGGETQRINLTRTLGSNLTSSMYILDEPSVGLHPRDTAKMVEVLKALRDLGNTVIVVEHEEEVIKNADYLVDIGPNAGILGGEVVFSDHYKNLKKAEHSLTADYLLGKMSIPIPAKRRPTKDFITIKGAAQHNLKNITVNFPLHALTVVSGVSGSGKTTLVKQILYPGLKAIKGEPQSGGVGLHQEITGALQKFSQIEMVNQHPIGKSSRSNPVTYVKAYDAIRDLYADQQLSKLRGYKPKHFSFNVEGGRCESCKGEGEQVVEMQFLADVHLECEECKGKRFQNEVLEVKYKNKSIFEVLEMGIEEALVFFQERKDILSKIKPLHDVGLGYIKMGQASSTLSGGEAQRVKLAYFLTLEKITERYIFIFDEPTTGLHFHDINKLLIAINALVDRGHTVIIVEHNMEVIKCADWIIDLGIEGGKKGGRLLFEGTPEDFLNCKTSFTVPYLKEKLS